MKINKLLTEQELLQKINKAIIEWVKDNPKRESYLSQRIRILNNNNWECQFCFNKSENMEIHHLDKDRTNNCDNNLIPLCRNCHRKLHKLSRQLYKTK